jgi:hypothetical protein
MGMPEGIGTVMRNRYIVIVIGIAAITASYWLAADPPNPWVFAIVITRSPDSLAHYWHTNSQNKSGQSIKGCPQVIDD